MLRLRRLVSMYTAESSMFGFPKRNAVGTSLRGIARVYTLEVEKWVSIEKDGLLKIDLLPSTRLGTSHYSPVYTSHYACIQEERK